VSAPPGSWQRRPARSRSHSIPRPERSYASTACRLPVAHTATLAFLLTTAATAYAAPAPTPTDKLNTIIGNITGWVIGILVGVATLFLTIGGLRYLAAGGDPAEVEKAKGSFKSALIGYALAILAPVLLSVVQGWIGG
jgi:hypothetical protein